MSMILRLLFATVLITLVVEFAQARDLKEIAKALRQKRENEIALVEKAETELLRQKRQGGGGGGGGCGGGRGGGGGCGGGGGGGGGCGCCCCCCCCCCGCGKKKRDILSVLRAKRNDIADDVTKAVANDWGNGGSSGGDYESGAGYGRGSGYGGDYSSSNSNGGGSYNGEGPCPSCDGEN